MPRKLSDEERNLRMMEPLSNYSRWQIDSISRYIGGEVLEAGGGTGTISARLLSLPAITSLAITETNPQNRAALSARLGGRAAVSPADLEKAAPPDFQGRFDCVVAVNVLEHVASDAAFFQNCCACLRKGGRLVLVVPAMKFLFGTIDEADSHRRRYEPRDLRALASASGLRILALRYMNLPGAFGWYYHGRIRKLRVHAEGDLSVFERLIPLFRAAESILPPPFGLSLIFVAEKPAAPGRAIS
ncbi:class I SAM-dependent methyltransferase [Candidatus Micrarchaeota archaeon]|nr:class I SAM-dependent methyltransferase [Candidatus Micrarchaeota archaeon]